MNRSQFQFELFEKIEQILKTDQKDINRKLLYDYQYISYLYATGQILPIDQLSRGILLMYQMGAGKTLPSIAIALKLAFQLRSKIVVFSKRSVRDNYSNEVKNYIRRYEEIYTNTTTNNMTTTNISNNMTTTTNNKSSKEQNYITFMRQMERKITYITLNSPYLKNQVQSMIGSSLQNYIIVIDEAHNFFNSLVNGSEQAAYLYNLMDSAKSAKFILLSGTPMINDPFEIVPQINLFFGREVIANNYDVFIRNYLTATSLAAKNISLQNLWDLQNRCFGVISYSAGDQSNFPLQKDTIIIDVELEERQLQQYLLAKKIEDSIKIGGAITGGFLTLNNISANVKIGSDILGSVYTKSRMYSNGLIIDNTVISPKADKIIESILQNNHIHLVYSQFLEQGISLVEKKLSELGFSQITSTDEYFIKKSFIVITGETSPEKKVELVKLVNNPVNKFGEYIKVILVTAAVSEGINFKNICYVHCMEPYWNYSRIKQVIARARRNKSHELLPKESQFVQPIIYRSIPKLLNNLLLDNSQRKSSIYEESVDQHIYELSLRKERLIDEMMLALRSVSINCYHQEPNKSICIICSNTANRLFSEEYSGEIATKNLCQQQPFRNIDIISTDNRYLFDSEEYIIIDTPSVPFETTFGKIVYKYSKDLNLFIRITGNIYLKILQLEQQRKKSLIARREQI